MFNEITAIDHFGCAYTGIYKAPYSLSPEGFDSVMATNHVGHFLLTLSLIDILKRSAPSRIVNVSSVAHSFINEVDYTNKAALGMHPFLFLWLIM